MTPHVWSIGIGLILVTILLSLVSGASPEAFLSGPLGGDTGYTSPYDLRFTYFQNDLAFDFNTSPRNNWKKQAEIPYEEWYSEKTLDQWGAWGPRARQYSAPDDLKTKDERWMQERIILVASQYVGLPYQHHRIPDWNPPSFWPWNEVKSGEHTRGMDCSDFSSFVYNFGLGIKIPENVGEQADDRKIDDPYGKGTIKIQNIKKESSYSKTAQKLKPGDILFFRENPDKKTSPIDHCAIWLGDIGVSPDATPLVIDSRGIIVQDSKGEDIPYGVYIRPFTRDEDYYSTFDHAHRIIPAIIGS